MSPFLRSSITGVALALCVSTGLAAPPTKAAARHEVPIVLAPGFLGFRTLGPFGAHWRGWREALEAEGFVVFEHMPTPVATSEQRAAELLRTVRSVKRRTGAQRVVVIGHSQGGLDARMALEGGGHGDIAAVATLSAPHHGTPLADVAVATFPPVLMQPALAVLQRVWQVENGQRFSTPNGPGAVASLTTTARSTWRAHEAPLFSFAAVAGDDVDGSCLGAPIVAPTVRGAAEPFTAVPRALIATRVRASNDGVVTTSSMRHGRFVGCVAGDHGVWLGWSAGSRFEHERFAVVLATALAAVARTDDERAFDAFVPALAAVMAPANHARPH